MAYEYEEIIIKQHLSNFRSKTGKLIDTKESLELREVYDKAKAFNEILDIDLAQHDEEYADNVMKVVNKYMEDK
ncbi:hypothetical protein MTW86_01515 [Mammaliicoccus sciuri]|uniref:hypothetical protein n=1 Tax=Mammaliicoccus sciuri TaxID=1296 RepID=UPI001FB48C31|nr:hypothetical protein [Mammaliicoccus sciuri]MCJ0913256.1 hypothetical protein [Mammaliicoccus sciuri]